MGRRGGGGLGEGVERGGGPHLVQLPQPGPPIHRYPVTPCLHGRLVLMPGHIW
jgi:hypothetical protein